MMNKPNRQKNRNRMPIKHHDQNDAHEHVHQKKIEGLEVLSYGLKLLTWRDLYHYCLNMSWPKFIGLTLFVFSMINFGFAGLYRIDPTGVANLFPENYLGALFFSVETFATVGYGDMHPSSVYAHTVATAEMFVGMISIAIMTGMVFARFSKPKARVLFARDPVVNVYDGQPTLMVRIANARQNVIANAQVKMHVLLRNDTDDKTHMYRQTFDLKLVRNEHPLFFLGWTVMHVIDTESPLYLKKEGSFSDDDFTLLLHISGFDETTAQDIQARTSYPFGRIQFGHRYVDAIFVDDKGMTHIDFDLLHETEPA